MEKNIFLSEGRIKRSTYWGRWLISFLITIPFRNEGLINFSGIVSIIISIFMIIQGIKRMHDVNKSGWYTLIPIYNLILALSDGTEGPNDYGPDPKHRRKPLNYEDEVTCEFCNEALVLDENDIKNKEFTCPECGGKNSIKTETYDPNNIVCKYCYTEHKLSENESSNEEFICTECERLNYVKEEKPDNKIFTVLQKNGNIYICGSCNQELEISPDKLNKEDFVCPFCLEKLQF